MNARARAKLIRDAEALQQRYAAARRAYAAGFAALVEAGAFKAPEHLVPASQLELGLPEPLRPDPAMAEAA